MNECFVYGTLLCPRVLQALLKRVPDSEPAVLHGYQRWALRGVPFPAIASHSESSASVSGKLLTGLSDRETAILDEFEGDEWDDKPCYIKTPVKLSVAGRPSGGAVSACAYVWNAEELGSYLETEGGDWSLAEFQKEETLGPYLSMIEEFIEQLHIPHDQA